MLHYRIEAADLNAHLYGVTLTIAQPAAHQRVSLPVWIAGSYMVREFAKQLSHLRAQQNKRAVAVHQLDKATWAIDCEPGTPLTLHYQVHAHDDSVRTAWLTPQRGFFNGTSLCLQVDGQADAPHHLELLAASFNPHRTWHVATGLTPFKTDRQGFGTYCAKPAASNTALSWQVPPPHSMANACCVTRKTFAKPPFVFGMAANAQPRPTNAMCSCSTPWLTAMVA
jgi:predicted metalloprotease with PDZ domain